MVITLQFILLFLLFRIARAKLKVLILFRRTKARLSNQLQAKMKRKELVCKVIRAALRCRTLQR